MTKLTLESTTKLSSGTDLPVLGFGVFESPPSVTKASVTAALESGYRHFDSAQYYENEAEVGSAILAYGGDGGGGISRASVFVTTKILNPVNDSIDETYESCKASVEKSGLGYLDLFLIHTPSSGPRGREIMWAALERCLKDKLVRAIGVSNFGVRHLEQIIALGGTVPSVNQIELHPYLQQPEITAFCQEKGIVVEAYCPLTRGERFQDKVLLKIAEKYTKSAAQVLIRWSLQRGFVPLPKSDTASRIKQNSEVFDFELSEDDMQKINALNENKSIFHNPVDAE